MNPLELIPELCLLGSAVAGLLAGSWLPRRRQWPVRALAAGACTVGLVAAAFDAVGPDTLAFDGSYAIDTTTSLVRIAVLGSTLLVLALSSATVAGHRRESEFAVLLQLAALGTIALAGANDLLLLFAAYLLASIPLYALAGFRKDAAGAEAAMKYYLLGALAGVVGLAGIAVLYGAGRATAYPALAEALPAAPHAAVAFAHVAIAAPLHIKVGGVPLHFWVPDVADGAPAAVAALVTTIPKLGGLAALYRILHEAMPATSVDWPLLVGILAGLSMTLGNLAAFFQQHVKRLLAYSTIAQVGYVLIAIAVAGRSDMSQKGLLFYLAGYAITNLGAFAVVAQLPRARTIADYRGLARRHPWLAAVLVVCLLGLVGTPPTAVFVGKLEVFAAAIDGDLAWLAGLAVANTVASLFYYLRWLAPALLGRADPEPPGKLSPAGRSAALVAYTAGAGSLVLGLVSGAVLPLLAH
ncbi:MAG: NADH-quinone oxidoreductase subunit N [Thermoleophilia bacterium]